MEIITVKNEIPIQYTQCLGVSHMGVCDIFYHKEYSFFDLSAALTILTLFITLTINLNKQKEFRRNVRITLWKIAYTLLGIGTFCVFIGKLAPFIWPDANSGLIMTSLSYQLRVSWEIFGALISGVGLFIGGYVILSPLNLNPFNPLKDSLLHIRNAIMQLYEEEQCEFIFDEMQFIFVQLLRIKKSNQKDYDIALNIFLILKEEEFLKYAIMNHAFMVILFIYYGDFLRKFSNQDDSFCDSGFFYDFLNLSLSDEKSHIGGWLKKDRQNIDIDIKKMYIKKGNYLKYGTYLYLIVILQSNKLHLYEAWNMASEDLKSNSKYRKNFFNIWVLVHSIDTMNKNDGLSTNNILKYNESISNVILNSENSIEASKILLNTMIIGICSMLIFRKEQNELDYNNLNKFGEKISEALIEKLNKSEIDEKELTIIEDDIIERIKFTNNFTNELFNKTFSLSCNKVLAYIGNRKLKQKNKEIQGLYSNF